MSSFHIIPEFLQLHYSFIVSSDSAATVKCTYTYRCQGCTIQRWIQHLSHVWRRSRNVDLNLGELFEPQCLRLCLNFFESRAANFWFCIRARLLFGAEWHSNADVDGLGCIGIGEQSTRLLGSPGRAIKVGLGETNTSGRRFQVVGRGWTMENTYMLPVQTPYSLSFCLPPSRRS